MSIVPKDPQKPITPAMWALLRRRYPDRWMREVTKAMFVATDYEACCALLRGETVPPSRIDWEQAERFGRNERTAANPAR